MERIRCGRIRGVDERANGRDDYRYDDDEDDLDDSSTTSMIDPIVLSDAERDSFHNALFAASSHGSEDEVETMDPVLLACRVTQYPPMTPEELAGLVVLSPAPDFFSGALGGDICFKI